MDIPATQICDDDEFMVTQKISRDALENDKQQVGLLIIDSVSHPINKGITKIGRHPSCHIILNNQTVSKFHAEIEADGTTNSPTWICDMDSSNKTKINNSVLRSGRFYEVENGSVLEFGEVRAIYKVTEAINDSTIPQTPAFKSDTKKINIMVPETPDSSLNNSSVHVESKSSATPFVRPTLPWQCQSANSSKQSYSANGSRDEIELSIHDVETQKLGEISNSLNDDIIDLSTQKLNEGNPQDLERSSAKPAIEQPAVDIYDMDTQVFELDESTFSRPSNNVLRVSGAEKLTSVEGGSDKLGNSNAEKDGKSAKVDITHGNGLAKVCDDNKESSKKDEESSTTTNEGEDVNCLNGSQNLLEGYMSEIIKYTDGDDERSKRSASEDCQSISSRTSKKEDAVKEPSLCEPNKFDNECGIKFCAKKKLIDSDCETDEEGVFESKVAKQAHVSNKQIENKKPVISDDSDTDAEGNFVELAKKVKALSASISSCDASKENKKLDPGSSAESDDLFDMPTQKNPRESEEEPDDMALTQKLLPYTPSVPVELFSSKVSSTKNKSLGDKKNDIELDDCLPTQILLVPQSSPLISKRPPASPRLPMSNAELPFDVESIGRKSPIISPLKKRSKIILNSGGTVKPKTTPKRSLDHDLQFKKRPADVNDRNTTTPKGADKSPESTLQSLSDDSEDLVIAEDINIKSSTIVQKNAGSAEAGKRNETARSRSTSRNARPSIFSRSHKTLVEAASARTSTRTSKSNSITAGTTNINDTLERNLKNMFEEANEDNIDEPSPMSTQGLEEVLQVEHDSKVHSSKATLNNKVVVNKIPHERVLTSGSPAQSALSLRRNKKAGTPIRKSQETDGDSQTAYFSMLATKRKQRILKNSQETTETVVDTAATKEVKNPDENIEMSDHEVVEPTDSESVAACLRKCNINEFQGSICRAAENSPVNKVGVMTPKRGVRRSKLEIMNDVHKSPVTARMSNMSGGASGDSAFALSNANLRSPNMSRDSVKRKGLNISLNDCNDESIGRLPKVRIFGTFSNPASPSSSSTSTVYSDKAKSVKPNARRESKRGALNKLKPAITIPDEDEKSTDDEDHRASTFSEKRALDSDTDDDLADKRFKQLAKNLMTVDKRYFGRYKVSADAGEGSEVVKGPEDSKDKNALYSLTWAKNESTDKIADSDKHSPVLRRGRKSKKAANVKNEVVEDAKEIETVPKSTNDQSVSVNMPPAGRRGRKRSTSDVNTITTLLNVKRPREMIVETATTPTTRKRITRSSRVSATTKETILNYFPRDEFTRVTRNKKAEIQNEAKAIAAKETSINADKMSPVVQISPLSSRHLQNSDERYQTRKKPASSDTGAVKTLFETGINRNESAPTVSGNTRSSRRRNKTTIELNSEPGKESQEVEFILQSAYSPSIADDFDDSAPRTRRAKQLQQLDSIALRSADDSIASLSETDDNSSAFPLSRPKRGKISNTKISKPALETEEAKTTVSTVVGRRGRKPRDLDISENNSTHNKSIHEISSSGSSRSLNITLAEGMQKVLFTGVQDYEKYVAIIKRLGGKKVDRYTTCTVLVTDKVRRTVKFLCALGQAKPIVSLNWLTDSASAGHFLECEAYILHDPNAEKTFEFSLRESVHKATEQRLLDGYTIVLTPCVAPPPIDDLKSMIVSCGGRALVRPPPAWPSKALIISRAEDMQNAKKYLAKAPANVTVHSTEFILTGILQQKLDFVKYKLL